MAAEAEVSEIREIQQRPLYALRLKQISSLQSSFFEFEVINTKNEYYFYITTPNACLFTRYVAIISTTVIVLKRIIFIQIFMKAT